MSNFTDHCEKWVKESGLLDKDSDYGGMIGEALLKMAKVWSEEGHSGFSAMLTLAAFNAMMNAYGSTGKEG